MAPDEGGNGTAPPFQRGSDEVGDGGPFRRKLLQKAKEDPFETPDAGLSIGLSRGCLNLCH